MNNNILLNKFTCDFRYFGIALVAALQGIDIGTTFFGLNNKLGYEANEYMAIIINNPALLFIFKSIPIVGMFILMYYIWNDTNNKKYRYLSVLALGIYISMSLIAPISNTYAIITGVNIFPVSLLPHNIMEGASHLMVN
jgi:hypothetical protein